MMKIPIKLLLIEHFDQGYIVFFSVFPNSVGIRGITVASQ